MQLVKIGDRLVGIGQPCFIVAEAGVNHNGDLKMAQMLIKAAKEAGADAVKFQTWITGEIVTPDVPKPRYQEVTSGKTQYEMLRELELSGGDFQELAEYSRSVGIMFLSTPEGQECTNLIERLGAPAFKIGSADLTNYPHLKYVAKKGRPMIVSTGMATLEEVRDAVEAIKGVGNDEIILLQCTSCYPARLEDANLLAMLTLRDAFDLQVGYSDHTIGKGVAIMAALLGASLVEKHLTLEKTLPGPDHRTSLEPREFEEMVRGIRLAEGKIASASNLRDRLEAISSKVPIEEEVLAKIQSILGNPAKRPAKQEREMIKLARKYIVAKQAIRKGDVITGEMLCIKRSGGGLEPKYLDKIVGMRAKRRIEKEEQITFRKVLR
jgi:N,N'-diacetyllegionaminate synthase